MANKFYSVRFTLMAASKDIEPVEYATALESVYIKFMSRRFWFLNQWKKNYFLIDVTHMTESISFPYK